MSDYIHPATIEAAIKVASNLLPDDLREVEEGHGRSAMEELTLAAHRGGNCVWFEVPNGKTAGMAGVDPGGLIWMLTTPAIEEYPITFAREAKRYVERQKGLLWNIVDERNTVHLKLLKFLGFKFLRKISHGPKQLSFIEFCNVIP